MKIFVDGRHGAAGAYLIEKLEAMSHTYPITFISIADSRNQIDRYQAIKEADIAVLCLPEEISAKTCADLKDIDTIIIDASTYHRTQSDWTYGYIELNQQQLELILNSKRIANAGCFANGMLCILNPIKDYLNQNMPLIMNGVTGYSAGGKQTIEKQNLTPIHYRASHLNKEHVHTIEVKHWLHLKNPLAFNANVGSFERGQMVSITLFQEHLDISLDSVLLAYQNFYQSFGNINVYNNQPSQLIPEQMTGRDDVEIHIYQPCKEYMTIHALYDNLGKGSAGSIAKIIEQIIVNNKP